MDKQWITEHYTEQEVMRAIQWANHPQTKLNKPLAAALKWACKNKPEIPKDKVDSEKENKAFAIEIETKFNRTGFKHPNCKLLANEKYVEILCNDGSQILSLKYTDKGFKEQFLNALRKIGVYLK